MHVSRAKQLVKVRKTEHDSYHLHRKERIEAARIRRDTNKLKHFYQRLLHRYNLSIQTYTQLLQQQNYECALCCSKFKLETSNSKEKPHVDHLHNLDKQNILYVRGLLCFNCNAGLGQFNDDSQLIDAALLYLTRQVIVQIVYSKGIKGMQQYFGERCNICKKTSSKLKVDHNHNTGLVRGVLCFKCNIGLGSFRDNIMSLKKAVAYLQRGNYPTT